MTAHEVADVIIAGAGIVGAACADSLTEAGRSVLVLDAGDPACGTTACAMGHVVIMDDSEAQFCLTKLGRDLWAELAAEMPHAVESEAPGTLWIAADDEEMAGARRRAEFYAARGVRAEVLDARELSVLEPNLRPGLSGALHVLPDRLLYPPLAARFLLDRAQDRRRDGRPLLTIRRKTAVVAVGDRSVRTEGGETLFARAIVCALGPFTDRLLAGLPITPRRGHLMITESRPGFIRHPLVELGYLKSAHSFSPESVAFNLQPRRNGQMLLGSSREFVGMDPVPNRALMKRMTARALEYMPALEAVRVLRTWVGFRPCAPDNLPLIGRLDRPEGVYVAAGHEGLGITTAPATGALIADLILGRTPPIDPAPYRPNRDFEVHHG